MRRNHPGQSPAQSTLALLFARGDDGRMRAGNGVVLHTTHFLVQEIAEAEREEENIRSTSSVPRIKTKARDSTVATAG